MTAHDRAEGAPHRVGWFSLGFAVGAVGMFLALAKLLNDNGWSLASQWDHDPNPASRWSR
jgi:hypothetical protein